MHILWLDPFHGGSHAAVAAGYAARSAHRVTLLTLPIAGGWRWRMRGGAVSLARMLRERDLRPDLIVASDMLDLATFRALTSDRLQGVPAAVYFHENQLTYPLPPGRQRDLGLAWINYTTALAADALLFNSDFHRSEFLAALPGLLGRYHDFHELETVAAIAAKAAVLPPGIDLAGLDPRPSPSADQRLGNPRADDATARGAATVGRRPAVGARPAMILWSGRWEYDKQPGVFFGALAALEARGLDFRLIVAGEHVDPNAPEFVAARARWAPRIAHWGYAASRAEYAALLRRADLVVSAALQEFFGIGVVEALYCGCAPLLPHRLNYPALIPPELHAETLYADDAALPAALARSVGQVNELGRIDWRAIAAPYDWASMAPHYDATLARLAHHSR